MSAARPQQNGSEKNDLVDDNRPLLLGATCTALATLVPVALFQLGAISTLPDPPSSVFDSDRITMSKTAHPFGIPDSLLGLASFGATLALALLAAKSRRARTLLGMKLGLDVSVAAFNATRQVKDFGKLCSWCSATALSAGVMAYAGRGSIRHSACEAAAIADRALSRKEGDCGVRSRCSRARRIPSGAAPPPHPASDSEPVA
jgi:uncharacterized membrane protein